ncbi:hypothetical protein [Cellulosimicrobium sp. Marseille-Q4280]|uniref:hypothetical protein n=1 Tax=Cellulosimicrobium sp. Marseille-Q4280 TaxID=2937992 RepID=UPI0020415079|nr:hypothetical protein [Cellulosimicrobium sp. Marseille-Q4280]
MNLNPKWIGIGAGVVLVVAAVIAVLLGRGGSEPEPEPTAGSGPGVTITSPVPTEAPADDEDGQDDYEHAEHDEVVVDPELLNSQWTFAEDADEHDAHEHAEGDASQWTPVVEEFVAAFQNTGVDDATWLAGVAPYLDSRLVEAYSIPGVRENVMVSSLQEVRVLSSGFSTARAAVIFADHDADMMVDLGLADTPSGWAIARIAPWEG